MIGGYNFMIFFFGCSLIFAAFASKYFLPDSLDMHTDSEAGAVNQSEDDKLSKWELFRHPNYLFALIAMGFGAIALNFYFTLLSLRLIHTFGLSQT
jgi:predicted MFS family arabinose efflux permease